MCFLVNKGCMPMIQKCFVYFHLGRPGLLLRVHYEGSFHWREGEPNNYV